MLDQASKEGREKASEAHRKAMEIYNLRRSKAPQSNVKRAPLTPEQLKAAKELYGHPDIGPAVVFDDEPEGPKQPEKPKNP